MRYSATYLVSYALYIFILRKSLEVIDIEAISCIKIKNVTDDIMHLWIYFAIKIIQ